MRNILVLGGGFGGVTAARHLERLLGGRDDVAITLVSRDNFFVLTPLLFEACSGTLELRHCAQPIRPALRRARFIEATVEEVDVDRQVVRATASGGARYDLPYDHLVVALGGTTNRSLIPGSGGALTFKSMADALVLRNHLIERLEQADVPTMVVWGDADNVLPAKHFHAAVARLPKARAHLFPATGHMPQIERAEEFAELVLDFWSGPVSS